jgi:hypothetical protein
MTGTEFESAPKADSELSPEEYHARWRELERRFPAPTWDEVKGEWKWLHDGIANGTFDPEYRYGGLAVAIYNKRVVGTDTNGLRLRVRVSNELGVHPERIVITSFPEA